jgi:hypothetical protein
MHGAKSVLKARVICTGIDKICETKLLYIPQSLKPLMFNEVKDKIARNAYESIYRIIYNLSLINKICQLENINPQK